MTDLTGNPHNREQGGEAEPCCDNCRWLGEAGQNVPICLCPWRPSGAYCRNRLGGPESVRRDCCDLHEPKVTKMKDCCGNCQHYQGCGPGGECHYMGYWPLKSEWRDNHCENHEPKEAPKPVNPHNYRPSVASCCGVCRWWQKTWECWHPKRLICCLKDGRRLEHGIGPPARPLAVCDLYEVLDA